MKVKALLYCTKAKSYLTRNESDKTWYTMQQFELDTFKNVRTYNGTIPCECEIEVEEIHLAFKGLPLDEEYATSHFRQKELLKYSCLTFDELNNYLQGKNGYALHISNLKVFDKPKELGDYYCGIPKKMNNLNGECYVNVSIDKAPQNMMYAIDDEDNEYILISIQPQWLCKILNGEKDIEIRKQVLNCMKN